MSTRTPKESTTWTLYSYDVWGNAKDGYEVNGSSCFDREFHLDMPIETANAGTAAEFKYVYPLDKDIRAALGIRCQFDMEGDDLTVYVNRRRDSYPIGEMHCTSHESLSPIRRKGESGHVSISVLLLLSTWAAIFALTVFLGAM